MADLIRNEKLTDDHEFYDPAANTKTPGTTNAGFVTGPGGSSSQPQQTGPGGTGGWTNIQSYLNANKGSTGSEKYLQDKVGGALNSDKANLEKSSGEAKSAAQSQVANIKDANENSKKWINDAAENYSWDGAQKDQYTQATSKLKDAYSSRYGGPTSYSYQLNNDTTRFGDALGSQQGYQGMMNDMYRGASGGRISRGGLDLQQQLDVSNEALAKVRQDLLQQYSNLGSQRDSLVTDTNAAIEQARTDFGKEQNALKDGLLGYGNELDAARSKLEADARKSYQNTFKNTDAAEYFSPGSDNSEWAWLGRAAGSGYGPSIADFQAYLDNPAVQEIARGPMDWWSSGLGNHADSLDGFYRDQRTQYENTADTEKRRWNTIQDILGSGKEVEKGFNVVDRSKNARGL